MQLRLILRLLQLHTSYCYQLQVLSASLHCTPLMHTILQQSSSWDTIIEYGSTSVNNFYEKMSTFSGSVLCTWCPRFCPSKWPAMWLTCWLSYCSGSDFVPARNSLVRMRKSRLCPAYCPDPVFGSPIASTNAANTGTGTPPYMHRVDSFQ